MLSVCIPVYNRNISNLLEDLIEQSRCLDKISEIVVLNDGSELPIVNPQLTFENIRFLNNPTPLGRSAARNRLINEALGTYVLLLDAGAKLIHPDFLELWLQALEMSTEKVFYGGSVYTDSPPNKDFFVRWKVSICRESKSHQYRINNPTGFKTNNVVIHKSIAEKLRFNEKLTKYGHEDTLYGFELLQQNIRVIQVDNPVQNEISDTNTVFVKKTMDATENLVLAMEQATNEQAFVQHVRLLSKYRAIIKKGFVTILALCGLLLLTSLKRSLEKGMKVGLLFRFDLFKLLVLHRTMRKQDRIIS